jgi:ribosomal RNA-processing protein 9
VDAAELDRELIASRLRQDVVRPRNSHFKARIVDSTLPQLQHSGKLHLFVADTVSCPNATFALVQCSTIFSQLPKVTQHPFIRLKGHRFSITSAAVSDDGSAFFTAGKEGSIIRWNLLNGKRLAVFAKVRPSLSSGDRKGKAKMTADAHAANEIQGHTDEVLALALSSDGRYLASGGRDKRLGVWDVAKNEWVRSFGGHRDVISVSCTLSSSVALRCNRYRLFPFARAHIRCTQLPSIAP